MPRITGLRQREARAEMLSNFSELVDIAYRVNYIHEYSFSNDGCAVTIRIPISDTIYDIPGWRLTRWSTNFITQIKTVEYCCGVI
ncbi:hypothetical protein [Bacteroides sp.]|uniref:hypothetical protein n=1 Tax=Bacteroides sp. TaxID=29523 RepID=UPI0026309399|nr:hypothetical protein [Bacteroides sp.]MDD3040565.1 hypothetical protein [Bacteroides sp.]